MRRPARGSAPPGSDPLAFLVVPLFDLVLFSGFIIAALVMRRQKDAHKRLMLLAYVSIIAAATARLPGMLLLGPPAFFGLALLFVIAGVVYDYASRGRVHPSVLVGRRSAPGFCSASTGDLDHRHVAFHSRSS